MKRNFFVLLCVVTVAIASCLWSGESRASCTITFTVESSYADDVELKVWSKTKGGWYKQQLNVTVPGGSSSRTYSFTTDSGCSTLKSYKVGFRPESQDWFYYLNIPGPRSYTTDTSFALGDLYYKYNERNDDDSSGCD